jgi:cytoskeletal protein CcmA (bactofilin family)
MAMFGRTPRSLAVVGSTPHTEPQPRALPASPATTTYVDESSQFTGTLKLTKNLVVDGAVEGEIDCAGTVTIGQTGRVNAQICAETVVIDGEIHGDIEARSEITLSKSARVYGDLMTEGIAIERGAKVEGRITIGPVKSARPKQSEKADSASDQTREVERPAQSPAGNG